MPTNDMSQEVFEANLLLSLKQALNGEYGKVHTPDEIAKRIRRRGRPVGTTKESTKQSVKLRLDPDVLLALRSMGKGWQTRVNEQLRAYVSDQGLLHLP
ncbi:hypothetical protein FACS1894185_0160 [Betaproteobacteria bacterium]|nr:hypothetical protein FACS1894185_0160 [Betaproteobacteria bacterium]GHU16515.1 hypothetical protein FACS189441_8480 [Betaproteobacteria bacterium]